MLSTVLLFIFDLLFLVGLAGALILSILYLASKYAHLLKRRQPPESHLRPKQDDPELFPADLFDQEVWKDLQPPPMGEHLTSDPCQILSKN